MCGRAGCKVVRDKGYGDCRMECVREGLGGGGMWMVRDKKNDVTVMCEGWEGEGRVYVIKDKGTC